MTMPTSFFSESPSAGDTGHILTTVIRPARGDDIPALVAMAREFLQTLYPGKFTDRAATLERTLTQWLQTRTMGWWVAVRGEEVLGGIGFVVCDHPLSGDRIASEVAWWVKPHARGVGIRLFHRAKSWAIKQGAVRLQMTAPTPEAETLYARLGFQPLERTFDQRLP